jgi:hypothetical protein
MEVVACCYIAGHRLTHHIQLLLRMHSVSLACVGSMGAHLVQLWVVNSVGQTWLGRVGELRDARIDRPSCWGKLTGSRNHCWQTDVVTSCRLHMVQAAVVLHMDAAGAVAGWGAQGTADWEQTQRSNLLVLMKHKRCNCCTSAGGKHECCMVAAVVVVVDRG